MSDESRSKKGEGKRDQGKRGDNLPRAQCAELGAAIFLDALEKGFVTQTLVEGS